MPKTIFHKRFKSKYSPEQLCTFRVSYYSTDPRVPALQILSEEGEPLLTASVNLHDREPRENAIFIKNYSENEGVQSSLEKLDLIGPPIAHYATGFVEVTEHMMKNELLDGWLELLQGRKA